MGLKFFRSLRFRILIMLMLIGIIPAVIAARTVVRGYESRAVSLRTMNVRNQCEIICNQLLDEDYLHNTSSKVINSELSMLSNIYLGRIMVINDNFKVVKDTYDLGSGRTNVSEQVISTLMGSGGSTQYDSQNNFIEIAVPIEKADSHTVQGVMLVSVSTNEIAQSVKVLERRSLLITVIIIGIVMIGAYLISGMLVHPLKKVTDEIEAITDGYQDEQISVNDFTETEQITDAFNRMLAQVKKVDESRQSFVSNVSHELKTPLTSMKVLADSIVGQEDVPKEVYKEFMEDISHEIDRENGIIQDLLEMVKLDKKAGNLNIQSTDIGALLEDILDRLRPIAAQRNIELSLDTFKQVTAEVDATKLVLIFTNLIENGIKYNVDDGWVKVSLNSDHKFFYVTVADSGIGIAKEDMDNIFERFYRVDKSHSTEVEGTGLGLALVKEGIQLHRGTIKVTSAVGEGSAFQCRIPLVYQAQEERV